MPFIGAVKTNIMNFKFLIISIVITSSFVGSAFAQQTIELAQQEFSQEEIDEMKLKAVLISMQEGTYSLKTLLTQLIIF